MCNAVFGVIRADTLKRTNLFGIYSNSDMVFLAELALNGPFVEIPERLFFRRAFELSAIKYRSAYERMVMFDPNGVGEFSFPNWRLFFGFLSAIYRAPVGLVESLRCFARMQIWLRRWSAGLGEDVLVAFRRIMRSHFRFHS